MAQDNEIDLSADEGTPSGTGSNFQDEPQQGSSGGFWNNPKVKKYAPYVLVGGVVLIIFVYMAMKNNSSSGTTTTSGTNTAAYSPPPSSGSSGSGNTGLSTQMSQQYSQTQQQLADLQNQINQENTLLTQISQNQSSQTYPTTGANTSIPISSVSSAVSSHTGGSGATSAKKYSTITVPAGTSQSQLDATAKANPGSPVVARNTSTGARTGYAISKAGANGTTDYTASNYNQAVNSAGGQWINHQFYSGSYNSSGRFVTKNPSQQSVYDANVPTNPKG